MKLQLGKRYVTRDGEITGELINNPHIHRVFWPFMDPKTGITYNENGYSGARSYRDLVKLYKTDAELLAIREKAIDKAARLVEIANRIDRRLAKRNGDSFYEMRGILASWEKR